MSKLQIGQRFDVWEILPDNAFAHIENGDIKSGQHHVDINTKKGYGDARCDGVWIQSIYGECYCYPVDGQVKKIGTLIITKVK